MGISIFIYSPPFWIDILFALPFGESINASYLPFVCQDYFRFLSNDACKSKCDFCYIVFSSSLFNLIFFINDYYIVTQVRLIISFVLICGHIFQDEDLIKVLIIFRLQLFITFENEETIWILIFKWIHIYKMVILKMFRTWIDHLNYNPFQMVFI